MNARAMFDVNAAKRRQEREDMIRRLWRHHAERDRFRNPVECTMSLDYFRHGYLSAELFITPRLRVAQLDQSSAVVDKQSIQNLLEKCGVTHLLQQSDSSAAHTARAAFFSHFISTHGRCPTDVEIWDIAVQAGRLQSQPRPDMATATEQVSWWRRWLLILGGSAR
jgi:hypothetical protein